MSCERVQRQTTVIDIIKRRKLRTFGHICRVDDNRLMNQILLGMTNSTRSQGRPARWIDDNSNWCGCSLPEAVHLALAKDKNQ